VSLEETQDLPEESKELLAEFEETLDVGDGETIET
jgi:hypothetical protein